MMHLNSSMELMGILIASLVGSWHCAGMCGPFAGFILKKERPARIQISYHFGRLITYSTLVSVFYLLSIPVKGFLGDWIIYAILIFWAVASFFDLKFLSWKVPDAILNINKKLWASSDILGGLALGISTTLLPCFWLYAFVGLALTRKTWIEAVTVIGIFWLGTLPALFVTHIALKRIHLEFRMYSRKVSLLLVIILSIISFWMHRPVESKEECPMHSAHEMDG